VTYKLENTSTSNPLVMEVVYRSTNGNCPAADVVTPITVYRGVAPDFANTPPTLFVAGSSRTTVTNTSVPVDNADFSYSWEFGLNANPGTANGVGPFNLNYSTPGPKVLRLTVTNRAAQTAGLTCVSSLERTIQIAVPPLIAEFVATPLRACFPTDITVTENQATGDVFEWRVFDSNGRVAAVSNVVLPVFQIPNPGRYTIELTTRNTFTGDQRTALKDAEIFPKPTASFQLRPDIVYVPDTELTTFNFSEGANEYEWDFGDGTTSIDREPKHKYKIEGRYDVSLIALFDHGGGVVCSDTLVNKVTAKQGGITLLPNAFTPDPSGPRGGVPGGAGTNSFNDVFLPIVKGAEEFNMQVFDRWGNLIFESNNAQVGWDGYNQNGRLMPNGVYVYKLTLRLSDGQRTTQIGDITLIR
jgi:gliding motility-associated-like protein